MSLGFLLLSPLYGTSVRLCAAYGRTDEFVVLPDSKAYTKSQTYPSTQTRETAANVKGIFPHKTSAHGIPGGNNSVLQNSVNDAKTAPSGGKKRNDSSHQGVRHRHASIASFAREAVSSASSSPATCTLTEFGARLSRLQKITCLRNQALREPPRREGGQQRQPEQGGVEHIQPCQTRRTTSHHRDNRMHRRDNKMRRRDNRMHRRDNRMRNRDNEMHRRDNKMRRRDNKMYRRDNRRRRRDNRQRHRDSGPLGRSKRGTSSSGPAAGAGARAAPGGVGGHAEPRCTDRCTPGAYGAVMATPLHVVQELKKQFGAMKQGRSTDIREELVRYAGRPVEAFDPQGPGPRGGSNVVELDNETTTAPYSKSAEGVAQTAQTSWLDWDILGISKSQLYPAQCLGFLVMEADSVRLAFRRPEGRRFCSPPCERGLNGAVRPQRRKAGCSSEITGQGKNRKVKEAEALMQALMSIEERVHSKSAAVVDAHVDNRNVISAGDNQGGKSLQLSRAVRRLWETVVSLNLHAVESQLSGCPASRLTKASDPCNSPSKFCDATEGEGGVGGTGQVPQVLLVANCGKSAGSMRGLTSAILTEEKWWLAVKAGNSLAPQGARGSAGSQAMAPGSKTGRTRKGRRRSKRRSELRQHSTPQQAKPVSLGKVVQVCEAIPEKRTSGKSADHNGRDQAIFKVAFFSEKTGDSYVGPGEAIGWSMAIAKFLSIELEGDYLF
ncbi:hypothetical protein Bbelb_376650 [Branchiostoma belcheri]|nr:hypothetical protein Bbelb_376650 [Branchiostoma belcheri]